MAADRVDQVIDQLNYCDFSQRYFRSLNLMVILVVEALSWDHDQARFSAPGYSIFGFLVQLLGRCVQRVASSYLYSL